MKVLIKQAVIVCAGTSFDGQTMDILVQDGVITAVQQSIDETADELITATNLHVSLGWADCFANFCDPGFEYRETLETGAAAAAAGGFTDVMLVPNTSPAVHAKSQVEYIVQKGKTLPINVHPIGAVTKNTDGAELAEMYDMQASGAVAFSDGINAIQNSGLLIKALQYVKAFNGTIIQLPDDRSIAPGGLMNEGIISTQLGLPGKPAMAEELIVARDIKLARYADSQLHFTGISSAKSLEYIRRAKEGGIRVSCSVTPYHLTFTDEDLTTYDSNLKVNPPLRSAADRDALIKGLQDGTIDCIASHHIPQHYDAKVCEFEYAKNGMIGLESLFGAVVRACGTNVPVSTIIELLTVAPRRIFGLPVAELKVGAVATLTLFDPSAEYVFTKGMIRSKCVNSAFIGSTLKGKVIGIVNGTKVQLN